MLFLVPVPVAIKCTALLGYDQSFIENLISMRQCKSIVLLALHLALATHSTIQYLIPMYDRCDLPVGSAIPLHICLSPRPSFS
jgi:hypothetical protein